uniref:IQ motif containing with AAA domain 1 n=2 Tax=Cyprinus carpio TaxID=7962 RepID=A0A8C1E123_CYPCA
MHLRPQKDLLQVFQTLATFYLRYLKIFRALEEVYDQIVHPQKRCVVHQVLEGIVELEYTEFHYFDDILQDFKMTPEDLEVPIPRYFVREKMRALKEREKMLCQEHKILSSVERAVWLLQVSLILPSLSFRSSQQSRFLCYRRRLNKDCLEEIIFLGKVNTRIPAQLHAQQVESRRQCVQEGHEAEYQKALVNIKESVRSVNGHDIKESLQEQIRQWFIECRDATGKFPDFPSPEVEGSACIFAQKTPGQVINPIKEERQKKKKSKGEKDKKGNDRKKKGKMKGKKGKGDTEVGPCLDKNLSLFHRNQYF